MKKLFITAMAFAWLSAPAQQKSLDLEQAVLGMRGPLAPKNLKQFQWIPGQQAFTFVDGEPANEYMLRSSSPLWKTDTLLRLSDLNARLFSKEPLRALPAISWMKDGKTAYFKVKDICYRARYANKYWTFEKWAEFPKGADNFQYHALSGQIGYTIGNNLYLVDAYGGHKAVTQDADADIVNGQSVHRNEFGIDKGIFFSPKGNYLAFYRMDQRMVADYPIIDWSVRPAQNHNIKYPMAGSPSHQVALGVYDVVTQKQVFLDVPGDKEQYLTCVTWSPDERSIYVAVLNRAQKHMVLKCFDARTGKWVKDLFEERNAKYVEPQNPLVFLPDGKSFLWSSQRDGYMHLYRYSIDGQLLNQVTKGPWLVNEVLTVNADSKEVLITANKESPLEKHGYAVHWENGKVRRLDKAPGWHAIDADAEGKFFLDRYQNKEVPREGWVGTVDKGVFKQVLKAPNTLGAYVRPRVEPVTLQASDGTPLYGKLVYPQGFDPSKRYPVIVYLYNGPHVQLIVNGFPESGNLWYDYMSQKGYFVFSMDGRGSSNRGLAFEQAVFKQLGTVEMDDQMKGVQYLRSLSFIDPSKMGIHGWSFGGFMTTNMLLSHPGVFKAGVAGGPVMDWKMYEIMYTERYMDNPRENPQGYEAANLISKAKNLKDHLLVIHGTQDDVVVWQHSIDFIKSCVDNGVQVDYFVYPGHYHNVLGKDRVHLMEKVSDYFDLYLK